MMLDSKRKDFVRGDATGLAMPAHGEALRTAGEAFLTDALRTFGSISPQNRIARITRLESFRGGNSGEKILLDVEYREPQPGLRPELFVKFSRDFTDAFRDRRRHELEAEVRLAALSRSPAFPIPVPVAYFADFNRDFPGTGILITQRIAFGSGNIEPLHPKCRDHELSDPLDYYRSIVSTLARLAGAHKSGLLSPQLDAFFPFDAEKSAADDPIPWDERQLRERVARIGAFAGSFPQLLPAHVAAPAFIARLEHDAAVRFLRREARIKRFLHADCDFVALCHYNANIDNAWFWRDPSGALGCGLLDWGRARQMNVAYALWGSLCAASLELWDNRISRNCLTSSPRSSSRTRRPAARGSGARAASGFLRGDDGPRHVARGPRACYHVCPRRPSPKSARPGVSQGRRRARLPARFLELLALVAEARLRCEPGPLSRGEFAR